MKRIESFHLECKINCLVNIVLGYRLKKSKLLFIYNEQRDLPMITISCCLKQVDRSRVHASELNSVLI